MKKWKILIPSLVATASMPLVGLVGCKDDNNQEEDDFITIDLDQDVGESYPTLASQPLTVEVGKKYRANIDISKAFDTEPTEYGIFVIGTQMKKDNEIPNVQFAISSYTVDGRHLWSTPSFPPEGITDVYWFTKVGYHTDTVYLASIFSQKLSQTSHITIDLMVIASDATEPVCMGFINGPL